MYYCLQKGIVHRNLKPEKVLFDVDLDVRLADLVSAVGSLSGIS